jgi:geranylgeranyl pyrophosphate synthase
MNAPVQHIAWEAILPENVNTVLRDCIASVEPAGLRDLLDRAVSGGKRLRPVLTALACAAAGGDELKTVPAGVALELLHASSLVHDDIMDHAEMRRGAPTIVHREGASMAVLAGDALLALSFKLIHSIESPRHAQIQRIFTSAFLQLCEGQYADIRPVQLPLDDSLTHSWMVERKTAKLVEACTAIGGLLATDDPSAVQALSTYGLTLGLAYQASDDLLDAVGAAHETGKTPGLDHANGRQTYLTLAYPEHDRVNEVRNLVAEYTTAACRALEVLPPSAARERLEELALSMLDRRH